MHVSFVLHAAYRVVLLPSMSKIVRGERKAKTRFQALLSRSRFSRRSLNDRIASANVEFNYSTEKKSSVEFSVERPKTAYNTCVYRSFRKNKKNSTEIPVELQ